jgi:fluoride exporter
MSYLLIGLGGAFGAICRYYLGLAVTRKAKSPFPLGTWIINITGSFFLGLIFNLHLNGVVDDWVMWLVGIGFCGAYTTFSTFGNETVQLLVANKNILALFYVCSSILVSFVAAWVGLII